MSNPETTETASDLGVSASAHVVGVLAEALAEHREGAAIVVSYTEGRLTLMEYSCSCGWRERSNWADGSTHPAHVASVVAALPNIAIVSHADIREFAAIEARASAVADAFHEDVPLELDTYVWKYAPGQQKYFTSIHGEQGDIAAIEGWDADATATVEALIGAVNVARTDVPALLAAVRERDNTIARVREAIVTIEMSASAISQFAPGSMSAFAVDALRAALDPQETPDGRM